MFGQLTEVASLELAIVLLIVGVIGLIIYQHKKKSSLVKVSKRVKRSDCDTADEERKVVVDGKGDVDPNRSAKASASNSDTSTDNSDEYNQAEVPILTDPADELQIDADTVAKSKRPFSQTTLTSGQQMDMFANALPPAKVAKNPSAKSEIEQQFIIINLRADTDNPYTGVAFFECLQTNKLRFGKQDIFHYHRDDDSPAWFKMANGLNPGTFDYNNQQQFETPMLCFIFNLQLSQSRPQGFYTAAFDQMIETIRAIQNELGGHLLDRDRSDLNLQTIEHFRQQVQDFERQSLLYRKSDSFN